MIIIHQQSRFAYFIFKLQSYVIQLLIWQNELDRIVAYHGTLTDMLNASTTVIKNFMLVSDSSFNISARTTPIDPPDDLHRRIIETGCLNTEIPPKNGTTFWRFPHCAVHPPTVLSGIPTARRLRVHDPIGHLHLRTGRPQACSPGGNLLPYRYIGMRM